MCCRVDNGYKSRLKNQLIFHLLFWGLFFKSVLCLRNEHEEVSLYGESFIQIPVNDASSATSISLQFRTHRPHGLLLLAAGNTDYVLVQLNAGIIETRVNLGSGEAVVFSARGLRLDDSRWHTVTVNRTLDTVFLEIDGVGQGQGTTPGTYYDLNIDLGLVLGGKGKLKKPSIQNVRSFRGCLRDVIFNDQIVLPEAKDLKSAHNAFQVSWHCDSEFFAPSNSPISLTADTSFVAFPYLRIYQNQDAVISCDFKSRSANAILLFNSGKGSTWEDFFAVELVDGQVKLSIDKGSGVIELYVDHIVNDGNWHQLEVTLSHTVAGLQVDNLKNSTRFHLGGKNMLNLADHLYIGGIGFQARTNAVKLGLVSLQGMAAMRGSMIGCVRNVKMNSRSYGFHQIQISRLVDNGCVWDFPCSQQPCVAGARCVELEGPDFRCDCDQQVCVKKGFRSFSVEENKDVEGIFSIEELQVALGRASIIDYNVIRPSDNILKAAKRESAVFFTVEQYPKYGHIEILNRPGSFRSFTLQDIKSGKIYYRHGGSKSGQADSTVWKVHFDSLSQEHESKIRNVYEFIIPIHIEMEMPSTLKLLFGHGNILSLSQGARILISSKMINVLGTFASPSTVMFSVQFLRPAKSRFELVDNPGRAVTSFSLKDVQEGAIYFQHEGEKIVYTKLTASDGVSESDAADLRFKEESLKIIVTNNTGILLSYGGHELITSHNLSSSANLKLEDIEILYHIIVRPSHGAVQKLDPVSLQWINIEVFAQRQIDLGHIRYSHQPGSTIASYDQFKFEVRARDFISPAMLVNVRFETVTLNSEHDSDLILQGKSFGKFSNSSLMVMTDTRDLNLGSIVFTVLRPPQWGSLYLIRGPVVGESSFERKFSLKADSTFSQKDISDGIVYYKLLKRESDQLMDYVDLQASYFGFSMSVRARIVYYPQSQYGQVVNSGLTSVEEGGSSIITRNMLFIDSEEFSRYTFTLDVPPKHGSINIVEPETKSVLRTNTSYFTLSEIKTGSVVYLHDDSEHDKDSFTFSVKPTSDKALSAEDNEIQEHQGKFLITIMMKNDNAPVRVIDKVFTVVANQSRHLTIKELAFKDNDFDFDSSAISYHMGPIANGQLLRESSMTEISNFTQADLEAGSLIFRHSGPMYGRTLLVASDGQHQTKDTFQIQATSPFLKVITENELLAKMSQKEVITADHLRVSSNFDFKDVDIVFRITEGPQFGHLLLNGGQTSTFTYRDILDNRVQYLHDGDMSQKDFVKISAHFGKVTNHSTLHIELATDEAYNPPEIVHNQILDVASFHSEIITSDYLQVTHVDYAGSEIEFIVTRLPERGHLTVKGKAIRPGRAPEFTQQDIDDGLILFTSDSSEIIFDSFMFDVGTEHRSLRDIEFLINTIPQRHQRNEKNVTIIEGGSLVLTRELITMSHRMASDSKTRIVISTAPQHGNVYLKKNAKLSIITSFSLSNLIQGKVIYSHDGSENYNDEFTLQVKNPDTSMLPVTSLIIVKVTPVDDEPPIIEVNAGLDVWTGSVSLLTNESLRISDPDSDKEALEIVTSSPTNGYLAYLHNPFKQISRFSQLEVDAGEIVFVHKGAGEGEFKFRATDGVNSNDLQVFHIHATPIEIIIGVNHTVQAFPNSLQPILNSSLLARASSANFTDDIEFTIVKPFPSKGKIISMVDSRSSEIRSFSQRDINEGNIFYKHSRYRKVWEETDVVHLEVSTSYAKTLTGLALTIQISYSDINDYNYEYLLSIHALSLLEGQEAAVTERNFNPVRYIRAIHSMIPDAEVEFSIASLPHLGYLLFNEEDAEVGEVFTMTDLRAKKMVYLSEYHDRTADSFQFTMKTLVPRSQNEVSKTSAKTFDFPITIIPVNDKPFHVITVVFKIRVIQGEEVRIEAQNLTTVDLDTGPEGITYTVVIQPISGMLVRASAPNIRLKQFTQKEINDNQIIFKHNGSREVGGNVRFKVSDGLFPAEYFNMSIAVTPLKITVAPDRAVPFVQGRKSVVIKREHLKVFTTGDYKALTYKITQAPQFGKLLRRNSRLIKFTQRDIDDGSLTYLQDEDSLGNDFFVCDIFLSNMDCSLDTVQFDIVMKPLVKQGPLLASVGSKMAITRASLDATELAQVTNDNPIFYITSPPKHGYIMRRNRKKREARRNGNFTTINHFTFQDIVYTKIYFVAKPTSASQDGFSYTLSAKGVPSAKGEFVIQLEPAEDDGDVDFGTGQWPKGDVESEVDKSAIDDVEENEEEEEEEEGDDKNEDSDSDDDVIAKTPAVSADDDSSSITIIVVVVSVLVVLIIVIVLILAVCFFRRKKRRSQGGTAGGVSPTKSKPRPYISSPLQLEQPHVFIEPQQGSRTPSGEEDTALMNDNEDHMYVNTSSHVNDIHDGGDGFTPDYKSGDLPLTEKSGTQMFNFHQTEGQESSDLLSRPAGGRGSSASTDLMEWSLVDPDVLQHCYNTTPVLRSNQYWL